MTDDDDLKRLFDEEQERQEAKAKAWTERQEKLERDRKLGTAWDALYVRLPMPAGTNATAWRRAEESKAEESNAFKAWAAGWGARLSQFGTLAVELGYAAAVESVTSHLDGEEFPEQVAFRLLRKSLTASADDLRQLIIDCPTTQWARMFNGDNVFHGITGWPNHGIVVPRTEDETAEAWAAQANEEEGATMPEASVEPVASPDFASVRWGGSLYTFTANQAACVKCLWNAWKNGAPTLREDTILAEIEGNSPLRKLFQGHPALETMIVAGAAKGTFRLADSPS